MPNARRVLIVKLSSLGDVIHTLPVVHDLAQAWPGVTIDWVVEPGFAPLLRRVSGIERVIECAQRSWRKRGVAGLWAADVRAQKRAFRTELREQAYDLVLDLQGLTKSALVARAARLTAKGERVAMGNRTAGSGYEAPTRWVADRAIRLPQRLHAMDRARLMIAEALGVSIDTPPDFGLRRSTSAAEADPRPCAVLVHGTSRDDKLWPEDHWIAFGRRLLDSGWRLALPQGSAVEGERARRLAQAIGGHDGHDERIEIWPLMSMDRVLDHMAGTQGVVGVDSGLSHLAVALGLSHVQLYNFPTAWRTGPQPAHGHPHQCSLEGQASRADGAGLAPPTVEAAWAAWSGAMAADPALRARASGSS